MDKFFRSWPVAAIFVSSLGHLEKPYDILGELFQSGVGSVIVIATQLTSDADDVIRVQHIRPPYVTADVTMRFLSRPKLMAFVEAHGGVVNADSEPGRGTTIRFTLPGAAPAHS